MSRGAIGGVTASRWDQRVAMRAQQQQRCVRRTCAFWAQKTETPPSTAWNPSWHSRCHARYEEGQRCEYSSLFSRCRPDSTRTFRNLTTIKSSSAERRRYPVDSGAKCPPHFDGGAFGLLAKTLDRVQARDPRGACRPDEPLTDRRRRNRWKRAPDDARRRHRHCASSPLPSVSRRGHGLSKTPVTPRSMPRRCPADAPPVPRDLPGDSCWQSISDHRSCGRAAQPKGEQGTRFRR